MSKFILFYNSFFRRKLDFWKKKRSQQQRQELVAPFLQDLQSKGVDLKEIGRYLLRIKE
jgi:hypothetical protein